MKASVAPSTASAWPELTQGYFTFNEPLSACVTCSGLGTYLQVHPDLLVPDKSRSIIDGAFVREAFNYDRNGWGGRILCSLAQHYGFDLDAPFAELSDRIVDVLFYGTKGKRFTIVLPPGATEGRRYKGRKVSFDGIINQIDRRYRRYRRQGVAHSGMEDYLRKVMVEYDCPDCGGTRLKATRMLVTVAGRTIHDLCEMHLQELRDFLSGVPMPVQRKQAGEQIVRELVLRLDLIMGIGLDYLSLTRRAGTLSGGEAQRIRLSTQIGSGLMGMLYVLDEPSIGLHPKDNVKMIETLRHLRDVGNTVIVVEHDEETIRSADHIIELGPGPGVHGGRIAAEGTIRQILKNPNSLTGQFLTGRQHISVPGRAPPAQRPQPARSRCPRQQPRRPRRQNPLGGLRLRQRGLWLGQELPRPRHSLQEALLHLPRQPRAVGCARPPRRGRAHKRCDQHRPIPHRPLAPLQPGHVHRLLRQHPPPLRPDARGRGARLYGLAL